MKVIEKGTDRKAEAYIHVNGKVEALPEYGEYVDPVNGAICCYIPVEEGHDIRIGGRFSGTTMDIAYDAVVDGVFCKTNKYSAKTVKYQNKKLHIDKFLHKLKNDIIDTSLSVGPLLGVTTSRGETPETIGTMELRLYITRQLNISHVIEGVEKYFTKKGNLEDDIDEIAYYKQIEPHFQMAFEKNCAPLEKGKATREQNKMNASRPGTEPWVVFRFYYRKKDAIVSQGLKVTYDPLNKDKTEPHALLLEAVPPLIEGTKPYKDDGDSSTQASSMPPDSPSTTLKSTRNEPTKTPTFAPKQKPNVIVTTSSKTPKRTLKPKSTEDLDDICARLFSKPAMNSNGDKAAETSAGTTNSDHDTIVVNTCAKSVMEKPIASSRATGRDTVAVVIPTKPSSSAKDSATKNFSLTPTSAKQANGITLKPASQDKEAAKNTNEAPITPVKKPLGAPAPINTTTPAVQEKPPAPTVLATSTKRASAPTDNNDAEAKRTKVDTAFAAPSMVPSVPRGPSSSPQPSYKPIEHKIADQRKNLKAMRQKRQEMAKKQATLEKEMQPYKKRMAEELDRLEKEMLAEEAAFNEENERYKASLEMLNEFKAADDEA